MPILVKSDDIRSGRKAKGRHGPLWRLGSQWVKADRKKTEIILHVASSVLVFDVLSNWNL